MRNFITLLLFLMLNMLYGQDSTLNLTKNTVQSKHTVTIGGQTIAYTATTGYMNMINEKGDHIANVFFVSYTKDGVKDVSKRPVTYTFNGGPGSSSVWLHLGTLGPRRIKMSEHGDALAPPYTLVDNEYSWLDLTDMVFIDPVGSGFSQAEGKEKNTSFYGYKNDVESVGEFIRLYTNVYKRWSSPKYIAGESYGTTRAAGLSEYLINEYGMFLNGVVLISCALDFQTLREYDGNDLPFICNLPAYTATALYHKKLSADNQNDFDGTLKRAEEFAFNDYATALLKADLLTDEKKMDIAKTLSSFIGIDAQYIYRSNLRVPTYRFRKQLLSDKGISVGRFDSRLTIYQNDLIRDYENNDPSYVRIMGAFGTSFNAYVRDELNYSNNYPFKIIGSVRPWTFADGKYLNVTDNLREAMIQNPHMNVWVANGIYDLATSYFGTEYALNHLNLPHELKDNIQKTYYKAGHMLYLNFPSLVQLKKDATAFYNRQ